MRVAVVGAGAMGGLWAAKLGSVADEVWAIDASQAVVDAIRADGIRVESADGSDVVRVHAATDLADAGEPDMIFVFVKAQHTSSVAAGLAGTLGPDTTVVSLQNGLGNADVLATSVPEDRLVVGVTYQSATLTAPGVVRHNSAGPTRLGSRVAGGPTARATSVAELMTGAGFETTASPVVLAEVWKKLVLNASGLGVSAVTGLRPGEMADELEVLDLVEELAAEAVAVARARGLDVDLGERMELIRRVLPAAGMGKGSMLQDVEGRRKTEVEVINGAVVREGRAVGVPTPLNQAVLALVHGLERTWRR
jgi:2-dehydropantoate 2-reductase